MNKFEEIIRIWAEVQGNEKLCLMLDGKLTIIGYLEICLDIDKTSVKNLEVEP